MKDRVVVAAGGTGGHSYPALVLCQTLRARGWETLVMTRLADAGLAALEREGIPFVELDIGGWPRRPSLEWLGSARHTLSSAGTATAVLRDFRPAAAVGMGGYLTVPAMAAAARLGVPRAVHDSNAVLGLANRVALALGARLFRGLPPVAGGEGTLTGTPIRPRLWKPEGRGPSRARLGLHPSQPCLLVFGGSQGAATLNRLVPAAVKAALERRSGRAGAPGDGRPALQAVHLAGRKDAAGVREAYAAAGVRAAVLEYLEDMETAYGAADLVVSRSGASTLAELAALRKPAVLVPYPHATGAHQTHNALVVAKPGAAVLVPDAAVAERLPGLLEDLLLSARGPAVLSGMAASWARLGLPAPSEAPERLADAVESLARAGRC